MKSNNVITSLIVFVVISMSLIFGYNEVFAHCDGMDGPVVKPAQKALDTGDVNLVLIWVQKKDESEIKKAFQRALAVRKLSPEAKELADMYFFETLVRVHRAGEGAPYTGLKPAGRDLGPAIPAADKALESSSVDPLLKLLTDTMQGGIQERLKNAVAKKNFNKDDVEAGREYVKAYVEFVHYVEGLYEASKNPAHGHFQDPEGTGTHKEEHKETKGGETIEFKIPESLKVEHEKLHAELVKATEAGGKIGDAAKAVAKILHPHFVKEEEYALPPLGLLSLLAEGKVTSEMGNVLAMTDRLKMELSQMLGEHKAIVAALKDLSDAAKKEKKMEYSYFAEKLMLHAQTEEEVLYPAAILIGEYLKLKLNR